MELLAVLAVLGIVGLAILPLLANTSARGDRVACSNNLRLIGRAFLTWSAEHGEKNPWELTVAQGGTRDHYLRANPWFQFFFISNHLASPKFLACPADSGPPLPRRTAFAWDTAPGGLLNVNYQNNSISYILGRFATPAEPQSILSGDRNLPASQVGDELFGVAYLVGTPRNPPVAWNSTVHLEGGNLLFSDGCVEQTDSRRLREALQWNGYFNSVFLFPFPPSQF
jgi:type II secretory pathway pseudopilin PulG